MVQTLNESCLMPISNSVAMWYAYIPEMENIHLVQHKQTAYKNAVISYLFHRFNTKLRY